MKELERLVDTREGVERELLCDAAREVAPEGARKRVLEALGIAAGGAALGSTLMAQPSPSAGLGVWAKLGTLLNASVLVPIGAAAIAGVGWIAVVQLRSASEGEPALAPREQAAPSSKTVERVLPELAEASEAPAAPVSGTAAKSSAPIARKRPAASLESARPNPSPPPAPNDDSLGEQLEVLQRVRESLVALEPDAALRALDDYARRFPEGVLAPEASLLRARALKQKQGENP